MLLAACPAVLDQDDDRDLRCARRREAGEPRVVTVEVPDLLGLDAADDLVSDLGRARLPREIDAFDACHVRSLALTLLVLLGDADDADDAAPTDDPALVADDLH